MEWSWRIHKVKTKRFLGLERSNGTRRTGVNFINILRAAFMHADPESVKKIDNLTVFFTLLGSARVKVVCRMLIKLSPGVNFINMFMHSFYSCRSIKGKNSMKLSVSFALFGFAHVTAARKMLMKSTPGWIHQRRGRPYFCSGNSFEIFL